MKKISAMLMSALMLTSTLTACGSADKGINITETSAPAQTAAKTAPDNTDPLTDTEQTTTAADVTEITSSSVKSEVLQESENISSAENEQREKAPVVLVSVDESYAWSYYQYVTVLDADGYYYRFYTEDEAERIDMDADDWYDKILEIEPIPKDEKYIRAGEETMKTVTAFTEHITDYKDIPMREYPDVGATDSGQDTVYGIYYDSGGIPSYVRLYSLGEYSECIDSTEVVDFLDLMDMNGEISYVIYFPYGFGKFTY